MFSSWEEYGGGGGDDAVGLLCLQTLTLNGCPMVGHTPTRKTRTFITLYIAPNGNLDLLLYLVVGILKSLNTLCVVVQHRQGMLHHQFFVFFNRS